MLDKMSLGICASYLELIHLCIVFVSLFGLVVCLCLDFGKVYLNVSILTF